MNDTYLPPHLRHLTSLGARGLSAGPNAFAIAIALGSLGHLATDDRAAIAIDTRKSFGLTIATMQGHDGKQVILEVAADDDEKGIQRVAFQGVDNRWGVTGCICVALQDGDEMIVMNFDRDPRGIDDHDILTMARYSTRLKGMEIDDDRPVADVHFLGETVASALIVNDKVYRLDRAVVLGAIGGYLLGVFDGQPAFASLNAIEQSDSIDEPGVWKKLNGLTDGTVLNFLGRIELTEDDSIVAPGTVKQFGTAAAGEFKIDLVHEQIDFVAAPGEDYIVITAKRLADDSTALVVSNAARSTLKFVPTADMKGYERYTRAAGQRFEQQLQA